MAQLTLRKNIKKKHKKWHPLNWLVLRDGNSTSVYNDPKYLTGSLTENEEKFFKKNRTSDECLNIFSLNIRSLAKHGGELLQFLKYFSTRFGVIVLNEIGSKNASGVDKWIPNNNYHYLFPTKSKCGGVGTYIWYIYTYIWYQNRQVMWLCEIWDLESIHRILL